jgi:hypothetical protein
MARLPSVVRVQLPARFVVGGELGCQARSRSTLFGSGEALQKAMGSDVSASRFPWISLISGMGWGGAGKERTNDVEAGSERGMTAVGAALFSPQTPRLKLMLKASVGACLGVLVLGHSLDMGAKGLLCARWKFRQPCEPLRGSQGRGRSRVRSA